jgi:hypothetical protein
MTQNQKIIRGKIGVLELAKQQPGLQNDGFLAR